MIFRGCRPANARFLRFRCSRTSSTLRSGSRNPPFSARPNPNLNTCSGNQPDWRSSACARSSRFTSAALAGTPIR
ncbi:hypothetical protein FJW10_15395 [Mesorhizobium sp. B4-1-1]|nr:hypothetical protein FJW10_15395 [Mesorhizobium sp. B4-1-1]